MRYGIPVNGKVTEPVNIENPLPSWASNDAEWLSKMFPGKSGWVRVSDDCVPGATYNGPGSSTNPTYPSPAKQPLILRADQVLDLMPATVVKAIKDSTTAAVVAKYESFKLKPTYTKTEGYGVFNSIVSAGLMTQAQCDAIVWPEA